MKKKRLSITELKKKAEKIKLIILDVDGVLTDGKIVYDSEGREIKAFNIHDGHGIRLLHDAGISVAIITGRQSKVVEIRASELGITDVFQKAHYKNSVYQELLKKYNLKDENAAFVGDDLIDLSILRSVGFAVAVSNAVDEVKEYAHMITKKAGGEGAVREVIDFIIKAQGKWDRLIEGYTRLMSNDAF